MIIHYIVADYILETHLSYFKPLIITWEIEKNIIAMKHIINETLEELKDIFTEDITQIVPSGNVQDELSKNIQSESISNLPYTIAISSNKTEDVAYTNKKEEIQKFIKDINMDTKRFMLLNSNENLFSSLSFKEKKNLKQLFKLFDEILSLKKDLKIKIIFDLFNISSLEDLFSKLDLNFYNEIQKLEIKDVEEFINLFGEINQELEKVNPLYVKEMKVYEKFFS